MLSSFTIVDTYLMNRISEVTLLAKHENSSLFKELMHIFNKIKEYEIFEYFFQCTLLTKFSKKILGGGAGANLPT